MRVGQSRKRDQNEPEIVRALERIGVKVHRVSSKGFADLVAWKPSHGLFLLEVKREKTGKLTKAQVKHTAEGWPVVIVRSPADALAVFGVTQ